MRKISYWAKSHYWLARFVIVFILYPLLALCALILGDLLSSIDVVPAFAWLYVILGVGVILMLTYPGRKNKTGYKQNYWLRKRLDFSLAMLSFLSIAMVGNQPASFSEFVGFEKTHASAIVKPGKPSVKKARSFVKKCIRAFRAKYRESTPTERVFLIILTVLVGIALSFGLAALCCHIACTSSGTLAIILLVVGMGGIIAGAVAIISRISRGKKKEWPEKTP